MKGALKVELIVALALSPSLLRRPALMARLMLCLDEFGWLRERALGALSAKPSAFSTLLATHVGALSPAESLLKGVLPLGWRMLMESQTRTVLQ